ncbi:MAG: InlB B-repeat-containing protein, partial [Eubacterium sp.]|nr:InlB B-repeat-containing protein [Eubacterium sp.]
APGVGEHTYSYKRQGTVNVYKWVVKHSPARCIHNTVGSFHGVSTGSGKCRASYYSGWKAYCADCGEIISPFLIYLSKSKVKEIKTIDLDLDYYYLCPTCEHLEQGVRMEHLCTAVSANRYQVKYLPGAGNVAGTMFPSYHVYNNSEVYEGQPITPNNRLSLNTYSRKGYLFAGWNTLPDGSGEAYEDGQEILNLSEENYDAKTGKGIVCLYAQWIKVTGTLFIDPGEGTYLGKGGITQASVGYGESLHLAAEYVVAPKGLRVHFETNGGKALEDVVSSMSFLCWHMENPCHGVLRGEDYTFYGEDGDTDLVTAQYQALPITLPLPKREGYSFGGWYLDPSFQKLAGMENDLYTPMEDLMFYAYWVDLRLNAVLNLNCHDGKGAVDLSWQQKDDRNKRYQIFQKREGEEFHEISGLVSELVTATDCHFSHTGEEEVFVIENSGFYELEVKGAQGQGILNHQGGLGGAVSGKFYFEKGEKLRISVGGQNGYGGGGQGDDQTFG